jgi:hypothetical protein
MTIHCFERRSLLRRIVGGILLATRPPRDQIFITMLLRRRNDGFLADNGLAGPPQHDDIAVATAR